MDKYLETFSAIPWLEVLLAALAMQIASTLWYAVIVNKPYTRLAEIPQEEAKKAPSPATMVKGFIAFFCTCSLLGLVDVHAQGNAFAIFASAFFIWFFIALDTIHATIWEKMPFKLFLIYAGNTLLNFTAASFIFWSLSL